jgi:hypothetical protein
MPKDRLAREQEMVVQLACHALTRTIEQYSNASPSSGESANPSVPPAISRLGVRVVLYSREAPARSQLTRPWESRFRGANRGRSGPNSSRARCSSANPATAFGHQIDNVRYADL